MQTKTKIILATIIVLFVFSLIVAYFVVRDLNVEDQLETEIINYQLALTSGGEPNESIVSSGDYEIVEKQLKAYLKEVNGLYNNVNNALNNKQISNNLTISNYLNDGPGFVNTKNYFQEMKDSLDENYENYQSAFTDEKINEYIDNENVSNYYKNYFKKLINNEDLNINMTNEVKTDIDKMKEILNKQEEVIDFLIANSSQWQIVNNTLIFYNSELESTYNTYVEEIDNL